MATEVKLGKTIAVIGAEGEEVPAESTDGKAARPVEEEPAEKGSREEVPAESTDGKAARPVEEEPAEEGSPAPARQADRERGRAAAAPTDGQEAREAEPREGRIKASPLA